MFPPTATIGPEVDVMPGGEPWLDDDPGENGRFAHAVVGDDPGPAFAPPSGVAAFELDNVTADPGQLSAGELVDGVVRFERLIAWATARQHALIAEFHTRPSDGTARPAARVPDPAAQSPARREWAADEIGLALTLAPGAAAARMAQADRFAGVLRPTRDLLAVGAICPARARLIHDMLADYDDEITAAVQARVLPRAPHQTKGQLQTALTRAILAVVPDPEQRHQKAKRERRVDLYPARDGMATLAAYLTATEATASYEWITRLARGTVDVGENGCERGRGSMDRRRADVLTALLTGRLVATATAGNGGAASDGSAPTGDAVPDPDRSHDNLPSVLAAPVSAHRPLIHITVPISTLMGLDDEPAELAGYGPIPADVAREIAGDPDSTWRRLLTDPLSGQLLDYGRSTYRPPTALAGFVRARDGSCRYPGCRRPAVACDIDHVQAREHDGATAEDNLCALCAKHHTLKHASGWRVVLHDDRRLEWITPTGHHYWSRAVEHPVPPQPTPTPPEPRPSPRRSMDELFTLDPPRPDDSAPF